jgi:hypothetical protein
MKKLLLLLFAFTSSIGFAADGDTSRVLAHQSTDLTWYKSYKDWAVFPASSSNWHEITLKYTMGCATGGCSDWDYTTLVNLLVPTGDLDSNIASIDTTSNNPLTIDTTWNVFPVKERVELAKVITPYGGSLANNWTRTFSFDVSDYYTLLHDSLEIEVFYQGWSSGFSATLEFIMIEGSPVRNVYKVENLYRGGFNYFSPAQFETNHMPARTLNLHNSATQFNLKMAPSGHGFINALNCAEFCNKDYLVYVDGQLVTQQAMWRDDCGMNGLWPQAGTWLYNRANWCPGDRVNIYDHDLSASLPNASTIDIDIEAYNYTVPAGETPANYNMSAQLFHLGDFNQSLDLALEDIIYPSSNDEYARFNPICNSAKIRLKNKGATTITSAQINYGLKGNTNWQSFAWTGSLDPLASIEVELPMAQLSDWQSSKSPLEFMAQIERVNGTPGDSLNFNNIKSNKIALTEEFPANIRFELRTNNAATETFWSLENASGTVLYSGDNYTNSTTYRDTFNLSPGCYMLLIGDRNNDGLSFFGNNAGSGRVILRNIGGNFFNKTMNPNFGSELRQYFTVGYGIGIEEQMLSETLNWEVYPNPSQGEFSLFLPQEGQQEIKISLIAMDGTMVYQSQEELGPDKEITLQLNSLAAGVYLIKAQGEKGIYQERIVIEK